MILRLPHIWFHGNDAYNGNNNKKKAASKGAAFLVVGINGERFMPYRSNSLHPCSNSRISSDVMPSVLLSTYHRPCST